MRAIAGVFLLFALTSCAGEPAPPPEMTNAERGQIQAEVQAWADHWLEAATNLDANGAAALFDQADGHFMDGTSYRPTWQIFLTETQNLYSGWESWESQWDTRRIDVLAYDAALFVGEASGLLRYPDGREFDFGTHFSFVLRKKDGIWKGLFGQVAGSRILRD